MSFLREGFPIEPGTSSAEMKEKYASDAENTDLPMDQRIAAANNYRELTCTFDVEYAVDPETGATYVSRSASGLIYSGPDDLIGSYDF